MLVVTLIGLLATMGEDTCAALAQVIPVFLIALVAERIVLPERRFLRRKRGRLVIVRNRSRTRAFFGIFFSAYLAIAMAGLEMMFLFGIDNGGYTGRTAVNLWVFFVTVLLLVIMRWLTPVLSGILLPFSSSTSVPATVRDRSGPAPIPTPLPKNKEKKLDRKKKGRKGSDD